MWKELNVFWKCCEGSMEKNLIMFLNNNLYFTTKHYEVCKKVCGIKILPIKTNFLYDTPTISRKCTNNGLKKVV